MTTAVAPRKTKPREEAPEQAPAAILERVVIQGDLKDLTAQERTLYYAEVCRSVGLNPLTRPFEYLELEGKIVLYATKACSEQLRRLHDISIKIVRRALEGDIYEVTAQAVMPSGRYDESTGVVALVKEDGEWKTASSGKRYFARNGKLIPLVATDLANARMKAETKAKRRATLSICGLGVLDESEIDSIPGATRVAMVEPEPAPALPAPAPAPAKPKKAATGKDRWAWLQEEDAKLAGKLLCEPGELLDHVQDEARKAGFTAPPEQWGDPAWELARSSVEGFRRLVAEDPLKRVLAWLDDLGEEAQEHVQEQVTQAKWNENRSTWAQANAKIVRGWVREWVKAQQSEQGEEAE